MTNPDAITATLKLTEAQRQLCQVLRDGHIIVRYVHLIKTDIRYVTYAVITSTPNNHYPERHALPGAGRTFRQLVALGLLRHIDTMPGRITNPRTGEDTESISLERWVLTEAGMAVEL